MTPASPGGFAGAGPAGDLDLLTRLAGIADTMAQNRMVQMSDEAIRTLREEVDAARSRISEVPGLVDYQASCLIECLAALAYARSEQNRPREDRAVMYIHSFRQFIRIDRDIAARAAADNAAAPVAPDRVALERELEQLEAANEAASGWGAAVGARHERIREIRSLLARMQVYRR